MPSEIALLAAHFGRSRATGSSGSAAPLKIPPDLRGALEKRLTAVGGTRERFKKAEVQDLVDRLGSESTARWAQLDPVAFMTVSCILVYAESCDAQNDGLYRLWDALAMLGNQHAGNEIRRSATPAILRVIFAFFVDRRQGTLARRYAGLELVELLGNAQNRQQFLEAPGALFLEAGKMIIHGQDKIMKLIVGKLMAQYHSDIAAGIGTKEKLLLHLCSNSGPRPVHVTDLIDMPLSDENGFAWDVLFNNYILELEEQLETRKVETPCAFMALAVEVGTSSQGSMKSARTGNITCNILELLSVFIPPDLASSEGSKPRFIDIEMTNIQEVNIEKGFRTLQGDTAFLVLRLHDYKEQNYLYLSDIERQSSPNTIKFGIWEDEATYILSDLIGASNRWKRKWDDRITADSESVSGSQVSLIAIPSGVDSIALGADVIRNTDSPIVDDKIPETPPSEPPQTQGLGGTKNKDMSKLIKVLHAFSKGSNQVASGTEDKVEKALAPECPNMGPPVPEHSTPSSSSSKRKRQPKKGIGPPSNPAKPATENSQRDIYDLPLSGEESEPETVKKPKKEARKTKGGTNSKTPKLAAAKKKAPPKKKAAKKTRKPAQTTTETAAGQKRPKSTEAADLSSSFPAPTSPLAKKKKIESLTITSTVRRSARAKREVNYLIDPGSSSFDGIEQETHFPPKPKPNQKPRRTVGSRSRATGADETLNKGVADASRVNGPVTPNPKSSVSRDQKTGKESLANERTTIQEAVPSPLDWRHKAHTPRNRLAERTNPGGADDVGTPISQVEDGRQIEAETISLAEAEHDNWEVQRNLEAPVQRGEGHPGTLEKEKTPTNLCAKAGALHEMQECPGDVEPGRMGEKEAVKAGAGSQAPEHEQQKCRPKKESGRTRARGQVADTGQEKTRNEKHRKPEAKTEDEAHAVTMEQWRTEKERYIVEEESRRIEAEAQARALAVAQRELEETRQKAEAEARAFAAVKERLEVERREAERKAQIKAEEKARQQEEERKKSEAHAAALAMAEKRVGEERERAEAEKQQKRLLRQEAEDLAKALAIEQEKAKEALEKADVEAKARAEESLKAEKLVRALAAERQKADERRKAEEVRKEAERQEAEVRQKVEAEAQQIAEAARLETERQTKALDTERRKARELVNALALERRKAEELREQTKKQAIEYQKTGFKRQDGALKQEQEESEGAVGCPNEPNTGVRGYARVGQSQNAKETPGLTRDVDKKPMCKKAIIFVDTDEDVVALGALSNQARRVVIDDGSPMLTLPQPKSGTDIGMSSEFASGFADATHTGVARRLFGIPRLAEPFRSPKESHQSKATSLGAQVGHEPAMIDDSSDISSDGDEVFPTPAPQPKRAKELQLRSLEVQNAGGGELGLCDDRPPKNLHLKLPKLEYSPEPSVILPNATRARGGACAEPGHSTHQTGGHARIKSEPKNEFERDQEPDITFINSETSEDDGGENGDGDDDGLSSDSDSSSSSDDSDEEDEDEDVGEPTNDWKSQVPEHHKETATVLEKIMLEWVRYLTSAEDRARDVYVKCEADMNDIVENMKALHKGEYDRFMGKLEVAQKESRHALVERREALRRIAGRHSDVLGGLPQDCGRERERLRAQLREAISTIRRGFE